MNKKLEILKHLSDMIRVENNSLKNLLNKENFIDSSLITEEQIKALEKVINILGDLQYSLHNQ